MNPYGGPHILFRHLKENKGISFKGWFILLFFAYKSTVSLFYSGLEKVCFGRKIKNTHLPEDPVFILGHYRSGTTLLHKLMAADPRFGYINTFDLLFPNCPNWAQSLVRPIMQGIVNLFRIRQKFFHNYILKLTDPNEEEPVMLSTCSPWSAYWGYVFPKRALHYLDRFISFPQGADQEGWKQAYDYFLRKFTWKKGNRRMVVKDPPHTGRIEALLSLYPNAKFVHIYRNPYRVFYSMRKLSHETILPDYATQKMTHLEVDNTIFEHYRCMMNNFEAQKGSIPKGNLVEIRYEEFKEDPLSSLRLIYEQLNLPAFEGGKTGFEVQLSKEKKYQPFAHQFDPEDLERIEKEWGTFIEKWGYTRP